MDDMLTERLVFRSLVRDLGSFAVLSGDPGASESLLMQHRATLQRIFSIADHSEWPLGNSFEMEEEILVKASALARGGEVSPMVPHPQAIQSIWQNLDQGLVSGPGFSLPLWNNDFDSPAFFPQIVDSTGDWKSAWQNFAQDFTKLVTGSDDAESLLDGLEALLLRHADRVPVADAQRDVSLAQLARSIAAISVCMARGGHESASPMLMAGADLSGIQQFLYDILGKNAAKFLKGRSFYLDLLMQSVVFRIRRTLDLGPWHQIYASGGSLFMLVPNSEVNVNALHALRSELIDAIFAAHGTSLFLALDWVEAPLTSILNPDPSNDLSVVWKGLFERLNTLKRRRYQEQLVSEYDFFFEPTELGGTQLRDAVTNEELTTKELAEKNFEKLGEEGSIIRLSTAEQRRLGQELRRARVHIVVDRLLPECKSQPYNPCGLGVYHYLLQEGEGIPAKLPRGATLARINELGSSASSKLFRVSMIGGNDYPRDEEGNPMTFDQLAGQGNLRRLGILRMDVDDLGQIFQRGIPAGGRTLARYASLSRSLDLFFKGYLTALWRRHPQYKDNTYILYSGGDDLFILGRWDIAVKFAQTIRKDFSSWTCNQPSFGLSGGIAVVGAKHPIAQAAELAAEAEAAAKSHVLVRDGLTMKKDSFHLLGFSLHWTHEFPLVLAYRDRFAALLESGKLPRSLLAQLNLFDSMLQQVNQRNLEVDHTKKDKLPERWRWLMAYQMKRSMDQTKDEDLKSLLNQVKTDAACGTLFGLSLPGKQASLSLIHLALRLAVLEERTKASSTNAEAIHNF